MRDSMFRRLQFLMKSQVGGYHVTIDDHLIKREFVDGLVFEE